MKAKHQAVDSLRSVSVQQWCELARSGAAPAVTIQLDGDSMRPMIRRNQDTVTIHPLTRTLKIGDVVLFYNDAGQYVVHRVWKLREAYVRTVGDNCWNPDPWMPEDHVLGLAVTLRRGKRAYNLNGAFFRSMGRLRMACRPMRNIVRSGMIRVNRLIHRRRR